MKVICMCFPGIVTLSAAINRMHLEIVSGRTLYAECQHKRELSHRAVSSERSQVTIFSVFSLFN